MPHTEILLMELNVSKDDGRFLTQLTPEEYATMDDALCIPVMVSSRWSPTLEEYLVTLDSVGS